MKIKILIITLLVFSLSFSFLACGKRTGSNSTNQGSKTTDKPQKTESKRTKLENNLPQPDFVTFELEYYSGLGYLDARMNQASYSDYEKYIEQCKQEGYIYEIDEDDDELTAFNENGYKIDIHYWSYSKQIEVKIYEAIELTKIKWPRSEAASLIPKIDSDLGKIDYESSDYCSFYIGNISIDEFDEYVEKCMDAGFTNNYEYQRQYHWFVGENQNGDSLEIAYKGFNTIRIRIEKAYEE